MRAGSEDDVPRTTDFDSYFSALTGAPKPYEYQRRMLGHFMKGRHVLLTAPTGCGKTWASVAPFLFAKAVGRPLGDRLFYALPLRALAASLKRDVDAHCREANIKASVSVQTGAEPEDELFDRGDLIFTTIDQLLSAYIHMPVSLPRRLANLNAGALVGSVLVFDEAHLLEAEGARRTMVHLLRHLDGLAQVVIATATLTANARDQLRGAFPKLVEEGPTAGEAGGIPALASRVRRWTREDRPLSAEDVRALHAGGRSLCVVNSVDQAQSIGADLLTSPPPGATVRVLHARFLPEDRARIEAELAPMFGPRATCSNVVLVATQVVEAGLDLSADRLLTELAPANALIQRAGRCARYPPPRNVGDVHVFEPRSNDAGAWRLGPYRADRDVVDRTWRALAGVRDAALGPDGERALLDEALGQAEATGWSLLLSPTGLRVVDQEVRDAWAEGDASALRRLVRDVQAVSIFATDCPSNLDIRRGPLSISLATSTWRGFLSDLEKEGRLSAVSILVEQLGDGEETPSKIRWRWEPIPSVRKLALAYSIPSTISSYDPNIGLVLGQSGRGAPVRYRERPPGLAIHYSCETYGEHVARIVQQARAWIARHPVALERVKETFDLPQGLTERVILLACALHDVAKLNEPWQRGARAWQQQKATHDPTAYRLPAQPLAHTDFDPKTDREAQRQPQFGRPPHAVEGALASIEKFDGEIGTFDLQEAPHNFMRRIGVTAIASHHAPRASRHADFHLVPGADDIVRASLEAVGFEPDVLRPSRLPLRPTPDHNARLRDDLLNPRDAQIEPRWWMLYGLVVRALRLSDQAATRSASAGEQLSAGRSEQP